MTIRERIQQYQGEALKGNLLPGRAAEILTELSALLGNINDEITSRTMSYNKHLLDCMESEKSANRAKIKAGTHETYKMMRDAINTEKVAVELIRALKYFLKNKEEEFKHGNN